MHGRAGRTKGVAHSAIDVGIDEVQAELRRAVEEAERHAKEVWSRAEAGADQRRGHRMARARQETPQPSFDYTNAEELNARFMAEVEEARRQGMRGARPPRVPPVVPTPSEGSEEDPEGPDDVSVAGSFPDPRETDSWAPRRSSREASPAVDSGESVRLMASKQRAVLASVHEDLRQASAYVREVHRQQEAQAAQLKSQRDDMKRHLRGMRKTQAMHGAAEALGLIAAEEDRVDRLLQEHLADASRRMRKMAQELALMTSQAAGAMGAALAERDRYERATNAADKNRARIAGNLCMERAEAAVSRGLGSVRDRMEAERMHFQRYESDRKSGLAAIHRVGIKVRDRLKAIRA